MRENFVISMSNGTNYNYMWNIVICLFLAIVIIYPILGVTSVESLLSIFLLFLIFYVIISSMTNENLSNELPSTLYPSLPHTGLDGISLNSYVAGLDTRNYI